MLKLPTHQRKKDHVLGGKHCFFAATRGASKGNWVGNCPLVYMLKEALYEDAKLFFIIFYSWLQLYLLKTNSYTYTKRYHYLTLTLKVGGENQKEVYEKIKKYLVAIM